MSTPDEIPHMDLPTLEAFIKDLEAKFAQAAVRTTQPATPPPAPTAPASPMPVRPPTLRREAVALWRIAMVCKDALRNRALPPAARPYFVQIAEICREMVQRTEEGQSGAGHVR
jgi:hypothetical protein